MHQARWVGRLVPAVQRTVAGFQHVVETFTQVEYVVVPTPALDDRVGQATRQPVQIESADFNRLRRAAEDKLIQLISDFQSKVLPEQRGPFMGQEFETNGSPGHEASPRGAITIKPRAGAQRVVRTHAEHGRELSECDVE